MNIARSMRMLFLGSAICPLTSSVVAQEPPQDHGAAVPPEVGRVAAQYEEVLELAPEDAWFVAYTAGIRESLAHPVLTHAVGHRDDLAVMLRALTATFDGPGMVAVSGLPLNPLSWRMAFAARTRLDRSGLFERLRTDLVPAWNQTALSGSVGKLQFVEDEPFGYLTLIGPVPLLLTLTARDGIAFGSSTLDVVQDWMTGTGSGDSFIESDEFKRFNADRTAPVGTLVYADLRSLVPMAARPLNETFPRLYEALQLDMVESVALLGSAPLRPGPVRLAVGVREIKVGVWRLLASAPRDVELAKAYPPDTTVFFQGSMERASDVAEDIQAIAAVVDHDIADEYDQERAEFKRDIGFDPHADFLANFVGAWAFGVRLEPDGVYEPLLALRLADVEKFKDHMQALRAAFQLEQRSTDHRGFAIERALRKANPFFYAVVNDLLLISSTRDAVVQAIDAIADGKGLDRTTGFEAVRRRIGPKTSKFAYLNMAGLVASMREAGEVGEIPPALAKLGKDGTAIGLAVVPHKRMIALKLAASDDATAPIADMLWMSLDASLERAHYLAARAVSEANVKGLLTACQVYVANHGKRWPPSLEALVQEGVLGDPAQAAKLLSNPYVSDRDRARGTYYLYRYIPDPASIENPAEEMVISEPETHDGGALFGFMDGHVEWITSPRADELLTIMRSGR